MSGRSDGVGEVGVGEGLDALSEKTLAETLTKLMDPDGAAAFGALLGQFMRERRSKPSLDWSKICPLEEMESEEGVDSGDGAMGVSDAYSEASGGSRGGSGEGVGVGGGGAGRGGGVGCVGDGGEEGEFVKLHKLPACPDDSKLVLELLRKVAVVKLNGGLGSRLGATGPKGAVEARSELTFLDLAVRQIEFLNTKYGCDVPLVFMNSFHTHEETVRVLRKYASRPLTIHCFTQSCFPRIDKSTLMPVATEPFSGETALVWHPPGHGDVWRALHRSGMLGSLIRQGKEVLFLSNVDNLGAVVDLRLLFHIVSTERKFVMEVTPRTRADTRGGTLVKYDRGLKLLEPPQVPKEHAHEFRDSLRRFKHFNTNSIWADARTVERLVLSRAIRPALLVNQREILGRSLLELETSAGAAIEFFPNPCGVQVPRTRFRPVKTTSDLLAVRSNLFTLRHGLLLVNPSRELHAPPIIKLGPEFATLADLRLRFPFGPPDLAQIDHLTISGDVVFGRDVCLKGTVIIVANEGSRIDVPDGATFEDKVITGHLRILEH